MQLDKILDAAVAAVEADEPSCGPSLTESSSGLKKQNDSRSMPFISDDFSVHQSEDETPVFAEDCKVTVDNFSSDINDVIMPDTSDSFHHPIEVSFFNLEDEGLVITSEQVMGMFENKPAPHNQELEVINKVDSEDTSNEIDLPADGPTYQQSSESSDLATFIESSSDLMGVSNEIEVCTTDTIDCPEYALLTPPESEYSMVPSCSSEQYEISSDSIAYDTPLGATVNTTVDADGKFLVQVVAPGINMTIPNHYFGQSNSKSERDGDLPGISEDDVLEAIDMAFDGEIPQISIAEPTPNADSNNNLENDFSRSCSPSSQGLGKRKIDDVTEDETQNKKKKHSDVMAALRASIFRSKARKMVNQVESENSTALRQSEIVTPPPQQVNCPCPDCTNQTDDVPPILKEPEKPTEIPCDCCRPLEVKEKPCACKNCATIAVCNGPCCNPPVECSGCEDCSGPEISEHEPIVIRPEDLPSLLKRNYSKENGAPVVMVPPTSLDDTDGDSLKVQVVYLVYPSKERESEHRPLRYEHQNNPFVHQNEPCSNLSRKRISPTHGRNYPALSGADKAAFLDFPFASSQLHQFSPHDKPHCFPGRSELDGPNYRNHSLAESFHNTLPQHKEHLSSHPCRPTPSRCNFPNYRKNYPAPSGSDKSAFLDVLPSHDKREAPGRTSPLGHQTIDQSTHVDVFQPSCSGNYKYGSEYDTDLPSQLHYSHQHSYDRQRIHTEPPHCSNPRPCVKSNPDRYHVTPPSPEMSQSNVSTSCLRNTLEPHGEPSSSHEGSASHPLGHCSKKESSPKLCQARSPAIPSPGCSGETSAESPCTQPPARRGPGRPRKPENERKRKPAKSIPLWKFLLNLLHDPSTCPELVRWEDLSKGTFRIVRSDVVAAKWGMRKDNAKMNYEKFSRAMRYYYKQHIFEAVPGKRLVYQFGLAAKDWKPKNLNNPNFDKDL